MVQTLPATTTPSAIPITSTCSTSTTATSVVPLPFVTILFNVTLAATIKTSYLLPHIPQYHWSRALVGVVIKLAYIVITYSRLIIVLPRSILPIVVLPVVTIIAIARSITITIIITVIIMLLLSIITFIMFRHKCLICTLS